MKKYLMFTILFFGFVLNIGFIWTIVEIIRLFIYDVFNEWSLIVLGLGVLGLLTAVPAFYNKTQNERRNRMKKWKENRKKQKP